MLLHAFGGLTIGRMGVGLYGIWSSPATREAGRGIALLPVLSWKSRLDQVKTVPTGASVGYDRIYRAPAERRIGVVPVGYADGYDRKLSGRGRALVRGRKVRIVGPGGDEQVHGGRDRDRGGRG